MCAFAPVEMKVGCQLGPRPRTLLPFPWSHPFLTTVAPLNYRDGSLGRYAMWLPVFFENLGHPSVIVSVVDYAKNHGEIKGAFLTFQKDADQIYQRWNEKLGYTGASAVLAATSVWRREAAAAAFVDASSSRCPLTACGAFGQTNRFAELTLDEFEIIINEQACACCVHHETHMWQRWPL